MKDSHYMPRQLDEEGVYNTFKDVLETIKDTAFGRILYHKNRIKYKCSTPRIYDTIYLSPDEIEYMLVPSFFNRYSIFNTYIKGGNWDNRISSKECINPPWFQSEKPTLVRFENYGFYQGAREYLLEGIPWEDTEYYAQYRELAAASDRKRYADPEAKLAKKRERIETLFEEVKSHGYKSQRQLASEDCIASGPLYPPEYHEVSVSIGRDGDVFFDDGHHRMIVAKLLGVERIPVRVIARHLLWQEIRRELATASSLTELSRAAKSQLHHPDVQDVITHLRGVPNPPQH